MKNRIIKIEEVLEKDEFYPRIKWSWQTAYAYSQAMLSGADFPKVVVAEYKGKYYLVDGKHRIEAMKINKEKHLNVEILDGLDEQGIFLESVKRNNAHGFQLSVSDKVKISIKLKEMGMEQAEISKLLKIPVSKLDAFTFNRVTNNLTGDTVILRKPLRHLKETPIDDDIDVTQKKYGGLGQLTLIKNLNALISDNLIDRENKDVMKELRKTADMLKTMFGRRKQK